MSRNSRFVRKVLLTLAHAIIRFFAEDLSGVATGLECIDWRVSGATRKWAKRKHGLRVKGVDKITQKAMAKVLAEANNLPILANIADGLWTSIKDHGSRTVVLAAHHDCAGDGDKSTQLLHLEQAEATVWQMIAAMPLHQIDIRPEDITVYRLWINENWMPEEISSSKTSFEKAAA